MKKLFITLIAFTCLLTGASAQTKSGILFGGSPWGGVNSKFSTATQEKLSRYDISYKSNMMLGYRFRVPHNDTPLFWDIDAMVGLNNWNSAYKTTNDQQDPDDGDFGFLYNVQAKNNYFYAAVGATANYTLFKNFSAGLGVEPTYWFYASGEDSSNKFDVPLVAKIGYNLKYFEIGLSYKHGLMNSIKTDFIKSGNFRDVQVTLWIPF